MPQAQDWVRVLGERATDQVQEALGLGNADVEVYDLVERDLAHLAPLTRMLSAKSDVWARIEGFALRF